VWPAKEGFITDHKPCLSSNVKELRMKTSRKLVAAMCVVASLVGAQVSAQNTVDPFSSIPYRNPLPLEQLLALNDVAFSHAVEANNGQQFRSTVNPFDPPGLTIFPIPLSFAGVKTECLDEMSAVACRLYVAELLKIQHTKEGRGAADGNPAR
jgi:hypothetical protein